MNLTEKIGAGLKVAACTSFAATYIGCVVEVSRAGDIKWKLEAIQEVTAPLVQELINQKIAMASMQKMYHFCVVGRGKDYLNDAGRQRCTAFADEYAGLEKKMELSQQAYSPVQTKLTELETERHTHYSNAANFMIYGSSSFFLLGGLSLLLSASRSSKRKKDQSEKQEESKKQPVGLGESKTEGSKTENRKQNESA